MNTVSFYFSFFFILLTTHSMQSQSVSKILDIEDHVIRLDEHRDIIRLEDGITYILVSSNDNQIKINNEWYTGRNLTEEDYELYDDANDDYYWIVKMLPDFSVDKVISFTGINAADITMSGGKLFFGFASYHSVVAVGEEIITFNEETNGAVLSLNLDLTFEKVILENDLNFLSFDASDDHLVMQFWMAGDWNQDFAYFGLDTLYNFDEWNLASMVMVVYDLNEETVIHNWIYGSEGPNHSRKITLTEDETIYTMFFAGIGVQYSPTDIDSVSWQRLAARYSIDGDLLWRTQPTIEDNNFAYIDFFESDNGDYYLTISPNVQDTFYILQDTLVYDYDGRPHSMIKYNYEGESLWQFTPTMSDGHCIIASINVTDDIVSGIYNCTEIDSLVFLDSIYTNYEAGSVFFNLNANTGEVLSSFLLAPHEQSARHLVNYLSHDYDTDKVYVGIESLNSEAELFGTTIGHLNDSYVFFIELDMNLLVPTDDLVLDNTLMRAYPNPIGDEGLLYIDSDSSELGVYKLYDAEGRLVISGSKPLSTHHQVLQVEGLASGVYILQYQQAQKIQNQIIIIK